MTPVFCHPIDLSYTSFLSIFASNHLKFESIWYTRHQDHISHCTKFLSGPVSAVWFIDPVKMRDDLQTLHFHDIKFPHFHSDFTNNGSRGSIWQLSIGSVYGLASDKWQAIAWTTDDLYNDAYMSHQVSSCHILPALRTWAHKSYMIFTLYLIIWMVNISLAFSQCIHSCSCTMMFINQNITYKCRWTY